ncbi:MAG TPA: FtsX-like permease family protein, partial [bacterium]|nr:FtsX-like permease family protein [bacterium]
LVSQGADGSVADDLFTVAGILQAGGQEGADHHLYLRLADAQSFLVLGGRVHEVAVLLKDIRRARPEAQALAGKLGDPDLSVEPWQVVEKDFYKAMTVDKEGDYFSQLIFLVLVGLGVLNTVLMNVLERVPEYGLLKALGTRSSTLTAMILWEMLLLSLFSLVPGAALAWASNAWLAAEGLRLPHPYSYGGMVFSTMYGQVSWPVFLEPAALIVLVAVLVCLPAALRIRRLTPIEALRRA